MPELERRQQIRRMLDEARRASRRSESDGGELEVSLGGEAMRLARLATAMHLSEAGREQRIEREHPVEAGR